MFRVQILVALIALACGQTPVSTTTITEIVTSNTATITTVRGVALPTGPTMLLREKFLTFYPPLVASLVDIDTLASSTTIALICPYSFSTFVCIEYPATFTLGPSAYRFSTTGVYPNFAVLPTTNLDDPQSPSSYFYRSSYMYTFTYFATCSFDPRGGACATSRANNFEGTSSTETFMFSYRPEAFTTHPVWVISGDTAALASATSADAVRSSQAAASASAVTTDAATTTTSHNTAMTLLPGMVAGAALGVAAVLL